MHYTLTIKNLQELFGLRLQYGTFLLLLLRGLCTCETVCLSRLSTYLGYKNQKSAYQRIRRFLDKIVFCKKALAKVFVTFSGLEVHPKWVVILDRTYWMFGKTHLSFLYMSVCVGPVCIPLFFTLLGPNKKGNSGFEDRKHLLDLFIDCFGKDRILYLLGDREFIGEQWLTYLKTLTIPFAQRLKEKGQLVENAQGKMVKAHLLFADLDSGEERDLGRRKIGKRGGIVLQIQGIKTNKGDLVIVASQNVDKPLEAYKNRWAIEICFRSLKSNGFHIEDSHVTLPHRIVCLLNIASLAYALTIHIANALLEQKPRVIKKHRYPEKGLIRYTLDLIKPILLKLFKNKSTKVINLLPLNYLKLVG
jgi:hypothetical protein